MPLTRCETNDSLKAIDQENTSQTEEFPIASLYNRLLYPIFQWKTALSGCKNHQSVYLVSGKFFPFKFIIQTNKLRYYLNRLILPSFNPSFGAIRDTRLGDHVWFRFRIDLAEEFQQLTAATFWTSPFVKKYIKIFWK